MALVVLRGAVAVRPLLHRHMTHLISSPKHTASFMVQQRFAHVRPKRALRLPREIELEKQKNESEEEKRSRNDKKKEAREAVRWGMDLASFSIPQIKRILLAASLEKEVLEALVLVKKLGPDVREGKRRQFNLIGKLLRDAQPDLLGALIQATKDGDQSRFQSLVESVKLNGKDPEEELYEFESEPEPEDSGDHIILASKWYNGFINKDIQISNEVYSIDSLEFDRQELRRLVRNVHSMQDSQNEGIKDHTSRLTTAKKSLNRFLISLAKHLSSSPDLLV